MNDDVIVSGRKREGRGLLTSHAAALESPIADRKPIIHMPSAESPLICGCSHIPAKHHALPSPTPAAVPTTAAVSVKLEDGATGGGYARRRSHQAKGWMNGK